jgi:4-oxalocrotonate tautomerase
MPHIVVKIRTGYPREQKERLAKALSTAMIAVLDCPKFDVSVGIEDVRPAEWEERVYRPDILAKRKTIYQQPGYTLPP